MAPGRTAGDGQPTPVVVGLGDPVMDVLFHVTHEFLARVADEPGGCVPVDSRQMAELMAAADAETHERLMIPGGSAANVLKGLANLGLSSDGAPVLDCRFVGMVGADDTGAAYRRKLSAQHVTPCLLVRRAPRLCKSMPICRRTARCLVVNRLWE